MLKIKRFKELVALFFQYVKQEGFSGTVKRATGFFRRRMKRKKGRFLPPQSELEKQKTYVPKRENKTISVVTALYNTDKKFLAQYIDSFLNQSYRFGQLVLADASDNRHGYVGEYVKGLNSDKIKYVKLEKNSGISDNTNRRGNLADRDYICLADHDDILSADALYQMATAVFEKKADFVYSDEALFDTDYKNPIVGHFKPDYSYYYLTNVNYICHLVCMKKSIFTELGGLKKEYDGAQDHDLFLKVSEIPNVKILHIPKVLYYWRVHEGSTSGGTGAKPYVAAAAKRAVAGHLARTGAKGAVTDGLFPSTYKVEYAVEGNPLVSILIPNKDHADDLRKALTSIFTKTAYPNYEVLVVENNSVEPATFDYYRELQKQHPNCRVVTYEGGFNFSAINNFGRKAARGEYLLLLNNDVEVINGTWLGEMLALCAQPGVGIVGAKLYYPDDTIQHAGVIVGLGGYAGHSHKYAKRGGSGYMFRAATVQDLSAVTAACLLVKAAVYDEAGGLDEGFAVAFNDVDLCLRCVRAGYLVVYNPRVELYHYESKSRGSEDSEDKVRRFQQEIEFMRTRWIDLLKQGDPYYNKNLTLSKWNYSLRA